VTSDNNKKSSVNLAVGFFRHSKYNSILKKLHKISHTYIHVNSHKVALYTHTETQIQIYSAEVLAMCSHRDRNYSIF